ncbi:Endoribonuclease YbeY [Salinivirga cyanobacteriivorans]|uniref:Endoribonuclease YbeY n=1 Tax=Salinivirga cyanobacteriivorans TaxID=1307839 RepID=A0A0S2I085_9BACT|nr:rRNA maturation RNase YbeY [Salinivirga cyanobacteriivorans]ALO15696.1 Endoribonuclease YbeY [Salinivirga cyanobacteriivorans]
MIEFTTADKPFGLYKGDFKLLVDWITNTIESENGKVGEINVINCSDDYLLNINKEHLDHHYYTDVITFDYVVGEIISGDIFVSEDRIIQNAQEFDTSSEHEFLRVVIHGVLHLSGYSDHTDEEQKIMRAKEDEYLKKFPNATKI